MAGTYAGHCGSVIWSLLKVNQDSMDSTLGAFGGASGGRQDAQLIALHALAPRRHGVGLQRPKWNELKCVMAEGERLASPVDEGIA